jgi:hypothetical protein
MKELILWVKLHLNWLVVFVSIVSGIVGFSIIKLIFLITGQHHIQFLNDATTFDIQAGGDIAILISVPFFYWILKQKKRSPWFLLFFVPPLFPFPGGIGVFVLFVPFWLTGFSILLGLENKQHYE